MRIIVSPPFLILYHGTDAQARENYGTGVWDVWDGRPGCSVFEMVGLKFTRGVLEQYFIWVLYHLVYVVYILKKYII